MQVITRSSPERTIAAAASTTHAGGSGCARSRAGDRGSEGACSERGLA